jgi:O-antigen ligase
MVVSLAARAGSTVRQNITVALVGYVVLLIAVPAWLVFAPLGAAGTPAQMLGIGLLVWWAARWLARSQPNPRVTHPVRLALFLLALAILASYVVAATRAIDALEMRAADRGLLNLCAWSGVVLVTGEGLRRDQLDRLLRVLVWAGGGLAALGVLQFVTGLDVAHYLEIPGLSVNADYSTVLERADFRRPSGTATHPIEFGVVLAMILPVAIHYALDGGDRRLRRWLPVAMIAFALPISISRSAVVGAVLVLLFLLPSWPTRRRRAAYAVLLGFIGLIYLMIPGLLGTLRNLFTFLFQDSSTESRTGSYSIAGDFVAERPVFGRGFGTFLPSYHIVDNQYVQMVIGTGIVGTVALVALFLTGILTARGVRRRSSDPATRGLAQSLAASVAVAAVSSATFDSLSFPMAAGTMFLLLGCVGALWRLEVATPIHGLSRDDSDALV